MEQPSSTFLIARTVWLDFARRKDFYVLLFFIMIFVVAALTARWMGVTNDSAARLLLDTGLALSSILSIILVALFSSRLLPEEFESRTLYPLLAKPVSRMQVLWAKFAGVFSLGGLSYILFLLLAWLPAPKPSNADDVLLMQSAVLQMVVLAAVAWMVIWLSIRIPAMLAALIVLIMYLVASPLGGFVQGLAASHSSLLRACITHLWGIVPDLSMLSLFHSYVDGASALSMPVFLALIGYGFGFAALFAALGMHSFLRKPL